MMTGITAIIAAAAGPAVPGTMSTWFTCSQFQGASPLHTAPFK